MRLRDVQRRLHIWLYKTPEQKAKVATENAAEPAFKILLRLNL